MLNFEKNDKKMESPQKPNSNINKPLEDQDKSNKNLSNNPENKSTSQINNPFSSPLTKKNNHIDNINNEIVNNDNNIYSPYVKRIDISGNKIEIIKDTKESKHPQTSFTSYKKITKKFYSPSPNLIKSEKLSDRFIPLNKGINLMEKFNLTTKFEEVDENKTYNDINKEESDNKSLYEEMLKNNFLNEYNSTSLISKYKPIEHRKSVV